MVAQAVGSTRRAQRAVLSDVGRQERLLSPPERRKSGSCRSRQMARAWPKYWIAVVGRGPKVMSN